ncbi:NACHT domain-containing protein [Nocardiopsis sp. CNT-189]|uniref:NB-ARC domain-containing protein n=1 Tax=Nocardiopsis oceanisediminis TaxID=2816862 RepID=UPI003B3287D9
MTRNQVDRSAAGAVVQAHSVTGGLSITTAAAPAPAGPPVPHELPPPAARFTNRSAELGQLRRSRSEGMRVVVLSGIGGVGKTALAAEFAHQVAADHPDGQIHLTLGAGRGTPVPPTDAVGAVLRSLGADPRHLPRTVEERAALLRTLTHGKRLLVLADDAADEAQIRPLLPATPGCTLIVTARTRLPGLIADADHIDVDPLPEAEAAELLRRLVRRAVPQLSALAAAAAGMPLAVCAIAGALSLDPGRTPQFARSLLTRTDPLTLEDSVDRALRTAVDALPDDARRLHLLCGLHPGHHITLPAAAALAGTGEEQAREALHMMTAMSLTRPVGPGVWAMHDVVREHAGARVEEEVPEEERGDALDRLIDHHLLTTAAADIALNASRLRYAEVFDRAPDLFTDRKTALEWWDREGDTVAALARLAHATGRHTATWQLLDTAKAWLVTRRPYETWRGLIDLALSSTRALGARRAEVCVLLSQAQLAMCGHRFEEAAVVADHARIIAETEGDRRSHTSALEVQARALSAAGRYEEALPVHAEATRLAEQHSSPRGVALKKRFHGETLARMGRHGEALELLDAALAVFRRLDDSYQIVQTLLGRTPALLGAGRVDEAAHGAAEAAELAAATDASVQQGAAAEALAEVEAARGDGAARRRHLEAALERYQSLHAPEAQRVQAQLRDLDQAGRG